MRARSLVVFVLAATAMVATACNGDDVAPASDAGPLPGSDGGRPPGMDGGVPPGVDAGIPRRLFIQS